MVKVKTIYAIMIKNDVIEVCETEGIAKSSLELWKMHVKKRFIKKLHIEKIEYLYNG